MLLCIVYFGVRLKTTVEQITMGDTVHCILRPAT